MTPVRAVALALGLIVTPRASAQLAIVVGSELQVNAYTTGFQQRPAVASEANGDVVVVWDSEQDGSGKGVFGRRYTSAGTSLGAEFLVNAHTDNEQWAPSAAMDADGDFVVVWHGGSSQDGSGYGVFGRRYASNGVAIGGEFQVNQYTYGFQSYPSVAMDTTGSFVVVWQSYYVDGSAFAILHRRFDSSGALQGTEGQVNWTSQGNQILPVVALNDAGRFAVAWESYGQDGDAYGVFAMLLDPAGFTPTGEIMVNAYTVNDQRFPSVGVTSDGGFVIAWSSGGSDDGDAYGVFARRFSSTGLVAGNVQVNRFTPDEQSESTIGVKPDGSFIVAWTDESLDGDGNGIFARRITANGATFGLDLQVNSFTTNNQSRPTIALAGNRFVVAWENSPSGLHSEIIARRGLVSAVLDFDGDGAATPLTDGLLVMRHLFGFSGTALTTGALGANCTRCTAAEIASYIVAVSGTLDIDDSGGPEQPLTDGLLVLRYLFGFRGSTLEVGATSPNCERCVSADIEAYLAPLV